MSQKVLRGSLIIITILCTVSFLVTMFFITSRSSVTIKQSSTIRQASEELTSTSRTPQKTSKTSSTSSVENTPRPSQNSGLHMQEISEAIDYLNNLQGQIRTETNTEDKSIATKDRLSQEEMVQLVREGVLYYDSLVESGSVDFFLEVTSTKYPGMPHAPSGSWEGTFEFSGSKLRGTVTRNVTQYDEQYGDLHLSGTEHFAYDGETFETQRQTSNGPLLERRSNTVFDASFDPRSWGWGSTNAKENLAYVIDSLDNLNIQQSNWNGTEVYQVTGTLHDAIKIDLWLDPEKSYRPLRHTFFVSDEENISRHLTRNYEYREVAPELWFPESATEVTTIVDMKTGIKTDLITRTMRMTDIKINEPISLSRFSINAPPGTTVFDARSREQFRIE